METWAGSVEARTVQQTLRHVSLPNSGLASLCHSQGHSQSCHECRPSRGSGEVLQGRVSWTVQPSSFDSLTQCLGFDIWPSTVGRTEIEGGLCKSRTWWVGVPTCLKADTSAAAAAVAASPTAKTRSPSSSRKILEARGARDTR